MWRSLSPEGTKRIELVGSAEVCAAAAREIAAAKAGIAPNSPTNRPSVGETAPSEARNQPDGPRFFLRHCSARCMFNGIPSSEAQAMESTFIRQQITPTRALDLRGLNEQLLLSAVQSLRGDKWFTKITCSPSQLSSSVTDFLSLALQAPSAARALVRLVCSFAASIHLLTCQARRKSSGTRRMALIQTCCRPSSRAQLTWMRCTLRPRFP